MDQNKSGRRPQKVDTLSARNLVFALAVSATIGFWAIFSKLDGSLASEGEGPEPVINEVPLLDSESQMAFGLPPIPTLIPTLNPALLAPVTANGLEAPIVTGALLPAPTVIKTPSPGSSAPRTDKDPAIKKVKLGGGSGGGEKTTNTGSSK
jgi:hypothetical protein